jgi:hypothetical protein
MRIWLCLLCCLCLTPAWAADWRDTLTPSQPGDFPPQRPVKAVYRFGWGGVVAAQANFDLTKPSNDLYELSMNTATTGFVRTLWRMDSQHSASCNAVTLRPIKLHQVEAYKAKTLTTETEFLPDVVRHTTQVTLPKGPQPPPDKVHKFKFGNVFDLQSTLLFLRSQKLAQGDRYRIVVFPGKGAYLADVEVVGREKVKVPAGSYDAIKSRLRLQEVDKNLQLAPHEKFKRAFIWVSDDRDRLVLKVQADIFVGSVWCELQSVEFTQ